MKRKKTIVLNWKMNPSSGMEAESLFRAAAGVAAHSRHVLIVAPPVLYLEHLAGILQDLKLGNVFLSAQNCFHKMSGAYTGFIGPLALADAGARYCIIGHSETRENERLTALHIREKVSAALECGLNLVVCVGEPGAVRLQGLTAVKEYLLHDLQSIGLEALINLSGKKSDTPHFIAYEPVWAISGNNTVATPDEPALIAEIASFLNSNFMPDSDRAPGVLYGGSVSAENMRDILTLDSLSGVLVGGTSTDESALPSLIYE